MDPNHSLYEKLKNDYNTLMMIDIQLKNKNFDTTTQVAEEFRKMIHCKFSILSVSGPIEAYNQV